METLLTILALVLLSAVSGWLKKRSESGEGENWPPPDPRAPGRGRPSSAPRPVKPVGGPGESRPVTRSWEDELRRLLEGESAAPPPPPPRPKAPPISPARPQTKPAPPPIIAVPQTSRPAPPKTLPTIIRSFEGPALDPDELTATARSQAQRLQGRAAVELKRAEALAARQLALTHVTHRVGRTAEIMAARNLLADPLAARQAVVASVILGPPVGL